MTQTVAGQVGLFEQLMTLVHRGVLPPATCSRLPDWRLRTVSRLSRIFFIPFYSHALEYRADWPRSSGSERSLFVPRHSRFTGCTAGNSRGGIRTWFG